jgi:hypothetical protein
MRTPVTSESALHEVSKPIPWNTRLRWHQIASISGAGGRHPVPEANLADAMLDCRSDSAPDDPGLAAPCEREELPDLLDFSIDIEQLLAGSGSLQQARLDGKVLKFEVPLHMKGVRSANLVDSSSSAGAAAKVIEFRRPEREGDRQ